MTVGLWEWHGTLQLQVTDGTSQGPGGTGSCGLQATLYHLGTVTVIR